MSDYHMRRMQPLTEKAYPSVNPILYGVTRGVIRFLAATLTRGVKVEGFEQLLEQSLGDVASIGD